MKKIIFILSFLSVFNFVFAHAKTNLPLRVGVEKGNIAPMFYMENLNGKVESIKNYRNKITILNFSASWCPACKIEEKEFEKFYNKNSKKINIISVYVDQNSNKAKIYLKKKDFSFPVFIDVNKEGARKYLVRYLPTSYILDEKGVILKKIVGVSDWSKKNYKYFTNLEKH